MFIDKERYGRLTERVKSLERELREMKHTQQFRTTTLVSWGQLFVTGCFVLAAAAIAVAFG